MTHRLLALFLVCTTLAACQPIAESSNAAMDSGKRVATDNQRKWNSLFTYTPPKPSQLPQTRYCYQTQSDVVCYDSPQTNMTAKLTGYQDGANMSAFQPGGGALGVSGGEATAGYNTPYIQSVGTTPVELKAIGGAQDVDTSPSTLPYTAPSSTTACGPGTPFSCNESPYQKGSVVVKDIPKP